jgi:hypothetical protein
MPSNSTSPEISQPPQTVSRRVLSQRLIGSPRTRSMAAPPRVGRGTSFARTACRRHSVCGALHDRERFRRRGHCARRSRRAAAWLRLIPHSLHQ